FTIPLPPLRDRGEDLPMLVQHFLRRYARQFSKEVRDLTPDALTRLRAYPWPGNIRELQNVLQRAVLQAKGSVLLPAFLPDLPGVGEAPVDGAGPAATVGFSFEAFIRDRLQAGTSALHYEAHQPPDPRLL